METGAVICPLCERPLGRRRERHHLVPRLKGGRETVLLHPICHRKIHSLFAESVLARSYASIEALRGHPEIGRFIAWLADKPPDFHASTRTAKGRRP
ncbi:HNH endonuclease [Emcibacter sp. SYSU 3D8]|uniref:HNH endonuclease n=1 Tax=Emcibacter sp. SYSU 3D8 TaxID=3133969 RepID=UPI0031FEC11A